MLEIKLGSDKFIGKDDIFVSQVDAQEERRIIRDALVEQINRIDGDLENIRKNFLDLEEIISNGVTQDDIDDMGDEVKTLIGSYQSKLNKSISSIKSDFTKLSASVSRTNNSISTIKSNVEDLKEDLAKLRSQINIKKNGWFKTVIKSIVNFFKSIAKAFSKIF